MTTAERISSNNLFFVVFIALDNNSAFERGKALVRRIAGIVGTRTGRRYILAANVNKISFIHYIYFMHRRHDSILLIVDRDTKLCGATFLSEHSSSATRNTVVNM